MNKTRQEHANFYYIFYCDIFEYRVFRIRLQAKEIRGAMLPLLFIIQMVLKPYQ